MGVREGFHLQLYNQLERQTDYCKNLQYLYESYTF